MTRQRLLPPLLVAGLLVLAQAGARGQEEIRYQDRAKKAEATVKGTITEETPAHIEYRLSTGRKAKIPALDVVDVTYSPRGMALEYRKPGNTETKARQAATAGKTADRDKFAEEAIKEYRELLPKVKEFKGAARQAQYKLALFLVWLAEEEPDRLDAAIKELQQFQADHPDGWQTIPAAQLLASLQERKGDTAAAQKTYEALAERADIPPELRKQTELLVVQALIDAEKYPAAKTKLEALQKGLAADDPAAVRVKIYLADCQAATGKADAAQKEIEALMAKTEDPEVLGLARNTLGDSYRRQGGPKNLEAAFWQYLWVDVLYSQDRQQHARALWNLSKMFKEVKLDDTRAEECLARLANDKKFAGLEYQKKALKEMK